ncbi:hypothetical protein Hamer_G020574 [Homarus americanus]|uniref:Uncharacterized protein n=1 Tax=Homarus americanus TaxID=6706 RepID=A0A8J5MXY6_HOMAM|nr:hypothetical protein Hamer_G020574 [Homarus americanus]
MVSTQRNNHQVYADERYDDGGHLTHSAASLHSLNPYLGGEDLVRVDVNDLEGRGDEHLA